MAVPIVKVKLMVNDRYLISEYGIYKGVTMNVEKYIAKSGDFVYYGMLIVRDDAKHNNAGKPQLVRLWKNEVKEIKPKKVKP